MASLGVPPAFNPCPAQVGCPGSDFPIANFSSEAPDQLIFFGLSWPGGAGKATSGGTPGFWPPLGSNWTSMGCFGAVSAPTQQQADALAEEQAQTCVIPPTTVSQTSTGQWTATGCFGTCFGNSQAEVQALAQILEQFCMTPPNYTPPTEDGVPVALFPNHAQTCTYTCPDGTVFTYTVNAGVIVAATQALADQMANSYACNQARLNAVCITSSPSGSNPMGLVGNTGKMCQGIILAAEPFITITGPGGPFQIEVTGGTMPTGLGIFQDTPNTAVMEGQATGSGSFSFQVTCTNQAGQSSVKTYSMSVFGLQSNTLPNGTVGTAYSQKLVSQGGSGNVMFSLSSGSLPAGLSLFSDGTVSGTPSATYP